MKTLDDARILILAILFFGCITPFAALAADVMGVDLEMLARDVSQEEEIVRAITHSLAAQGMVQAPYKSEALDVRRPGYYQKMRTSASSSGSVSISVFAGRTTREVRVNMQGTRSRLPPAASFSHDWDAVLVTDSTMEMRAGADHATL